MREGIGVRTAGIREEYPLNTIGRGVRSRNNVNPDPQACMYVCISDAFPGLVGGRAGMGRCEW